MHTWTFDADSKIIRFYLWLWKADPANIDFCRLFWGYVFCWVALLLKPIDTVAAAIARRIPDRSEPTLAERLRTEDLRREKKEAKAAVPPSPHAVVAQLGRGPGSNPGQWRFESSRRHPRLTSAP